GVPATSSMGNAATGLGAGHEWARRGGENPAPAGPGRLPSDRGGTGPTVSPGPARRGVRPGRANRRGAGGAGRGVGNAGQERSALVGGGATSAQGRAAVAACGATARGGGSLLPPGPRHCPPPAGQVLGAAGGHEPGAVVAEQGEA